jgi:hypothetical protein
VLCVRSRKVVRKGDAEGPLSGVGPSSVMTLPQLVIMPPFLDFKERYRPTHSRSYCTRSHFTTITIISSFRPLCASVNSEFFPLFSSERFFALDSPQFLHFAVVVRFCRR